MMREVDYKGWANYLVLLMKAAGKESRRSKIAGEKLCEFACGTGNISLMMSRLGYDVTGIDSSSDMLRVAEKKLARRNSRPVHLIHGDMVTCSAKDAFDRAICVYDSINYISTTDSLRQFFANVHGALKPGGVFVFDASLESNSLSHSSLFVQRGRHKGIYYHRKSQYDPKQKIHTTYVRIRKNGRVVEEVHREYVYKLELLRELFSSTGFEERIAAGDFTMLEPDNLSERVHFVLVKKTHD